MGKKKKADVSEQVKVSKEEAEAIEDELVTASTIPPAPLPVVGQDIESMCKDLCDRVIAQHYGNVPKGMEMRSFVKVDSSAKGCQLQVQILPVKL